MAAARLAVVMARTAGVTVIERDPETAVAPSESVTLTDRVAVPVPAGVPVMKPAALRDSPEGSAPLFSVHVYGASPPLAARAAL